MDRINEFALELGKKFDKDIVKEHFEKHEVQLLKLILSQLRVKTQEYLFSFEQLQNLGFDPKNNDKVLFEGLKKIANYYINIKSGYGDYHQVGLIDNKFTIDQEMKILSLKVHKELLPFLNSLKGKYIPLIDVEVDGNV